MRTTVIAVPTDRIVDWESFHSVFEESLGFPSYYGRNMDAWIDCLTYADDKDAGMISRPVAKGELLTLRLDDAASFERRCPEQYRALVECSAFVNYRRADAGEEPVVALLPVGWFGPE